MVRTGATDQMILSSQVNAYWDKMTVAKTVY